MRVSEVPFSITAVKGGITAAAGFRASGVAAGIKASGALDVTLIVADAPVPAAGLFTTNQVQAAPVKVSRANLLSSGGHAQAVIVNSGCANACTGAEGLATTEATVAATAAALGCAPEHVLVASTGVIGVQLSRDKMLAGVKSAASSLSRDGAPAARGIMTTDLGPKEHAVHVETARGIFHVGGIAKGAGMIEPMLATMLSFITTDAAVPPALLDRALREVTGRTFNAITVDGECSTNDTLAVLASGASGVTIDESCYPALVAGLEAVARTLALAIVRGGEGATKLVAIHVTGAVNDQDAMRAAKTIANSPLVKTAVHGGDPNWGRLVAASGRSGARFVLEHATVEVGDVLLFRNGQPYDENASEAAKLLQDSDIDIHVDLGAGGSGEATAWTCDLSAEYVRINGEYPDMSRPSTLRAGARVRALKPTPPPAPMKARSFISLGDFTPEAIDRCLELAAELKSARAAGRRGDYAPLANRHVALLFDKPSLRTRVTFEVAVRELGGSPILLPADVALGSREPVADVARNLERWVDVVVIRTFAQQIVEEFACAAPTLRLINALTDEEHPCQALADVLTLRERFGDLTGRTIAYVGDGNNVATSLAEACVMQGMHVRIASPEGYELPAAIQQRVATEGRDGATLTLLDDPIAAVRGASAVYTDVWTSMGQENETVIRKRAFAGFQVNESLMAHASPDAIFMHCLPAHRGEEVSAGVMDGPSSVVFDQAENRLHAQKALLAMLFE